MGFPLCVGRGHLCAGNPFGVNEGKAGEVEVVTVDPPREGGLVMVDSDGGLEGGCGGGPDFTDAAGTCGVVVG